MAQPRRKTMYWYGFPEINDRGKHVDAVRIIRKLKPEWADNFWLQHNSLAWYSWERRQLRHQRMTHGKHTGRARRAR